MSELLVEKTNPILQLFSSEMVDYDFNFEKIPYIVVVKRDGDIRRFALLLGENYCGYAHGTLLEEMDLTVTDPDEFYYAGNFSFRENKIIIPDPQKTGQWNLQTDDDSTHFKKAIKHIISPEVYIKKY